MIQMNHKPRAARGSCTTWLMILSVYPVAPTLQREHCHRNQKLRNTDITKTTPTNVGRPSPIEQAETACQSKKICFLQHIGLTVAGMKHAGKARMLLAGISKHSSVIQPFPKLIQQTWLQSCFLCMAEPVA